MKMSPDHNQDNWNDNIQLHLSGIETMPLNDTTDSFYPADARDINESNELSIPWDTCCLTQQHEQS